MRSRKPVFAVALCLALLLLAAAAWLFRSKDNKDKSGADNAPPAEAVVSSASTTAPTVTLTPSQLQAITLGTLGTAAFPRDIHAPGNIDFDQNRNVQVFPPYPGEIIEAFGNLGDPVKKGDPLYTIDSPDFIQAESNLISSAAALDLANRTLDRAKSLNAGDNGVSQRELEQDVAAQQSAEGALRAARQSVKVFGKTDQEIDAIIATGDVEPALVVRSPFDGRIVQKTAPTGLMVQPGNAPAPYAVADLSLKWMVANVSESDSPLVKEGQPVWVSVSVLPGKNFSGIVSRTGAAVDPVTHRVMVRAEIEDPENLLRPGMLADFTIQVVPPADGVSIPANGVVRNGDGTFSAWVTRDRKVFTERMIKIGPLRDGNYEVTEGLSTGETAVIDGAVFLSNMLQAPVDDD